MVTLKNTGLETFIATYYTSICGRRSGAKLYSVRKVRSPRGKIVGVKQPHSFSIVPGEQASVHDVALHLPQVKSARKSGWLEVVNWNKPAIDSQVDVYVEGYTSKREGDER